MSATGLPGRNPARVPMTDSHRSRRPEASVVPSAGQATRTNRRTGNIRDRSEAFNSASVR